MIMEPYSDKKINEIRHTIEEIKEDIENIKTKNGKTIYNMMESLSKIGENDHKIGDNYCTHKDNEDYDIEKELLYRKYTSDNIAMNRQSLGFSKATTNMNSQESYQFNDVILNSNQWKLYDNVQKSIAIEQADKKKDEGKKDQTNYDIQLDKISNSVELEKQISELQVTISELEKKNALLQKQLADVQKNEAKVSQEAERMENNAVIIEEVKKRLNLHDSEEILPTIDDLLNTEKECKLKDELVNKLTKLYLTLGGKEKDNHVEVKTIWRWIKQMINTIKAHIQSANEAESKDCMKKETGEKKEIEKERVKEKESEHFKDYCNKLIKEYKLKDFSDLQEFINRLLTKNKLNKNRVEKLKKVLMIEPPMMAKYQDTNDL